MLAAAYPINLSPDTGLLHSVWDSALSGVHHCLRCAPHGLVLALRMPPPAFASPTLHSCTPAAGTPYQVKR